MHEQVTSLITLDAVAQEYVRAAAAPSTLRAYRSDWQHFTGWCADHDRDALPASPPTVAMYIADLAQQGRKASTIARRLAAISQAHQAARLSSPSGDVAVRKVAAGIRRSLGVAPSQKAPIATDELKAILAVLPDDLRGRRDKALLLLGFAAALRRSELAALNVDDVQQSARGIVVNLRRSKTDQEAHGRPIGVPYGKNADTCPVRALIAWRTAAGVLDGPLFRPIDRWNHVGDGRLSDRQVARIVQAAAAAAGLDASRFGGHSLRAGLATAAALGGAPDRVIAKTTGHKSMRVLAGYVRVGELFKENAMSYAGL